MPTESFEESDVADTELADRLNNQAEAALDVFVSRFSGLLSQAWERFQSVVSKCRIEQSTVTPFIGKAAGRGYLRYCVQKEMDIPLDDYVLALQLKDLTLTGACVYEDGASIQHLDSLISQKVLPTLLSLWRRGSLSGVSRTSIEEVGGALIGHLWIRTRNGDIRLATYLGRCRLTSWLVGVARHLVIDESRKLRNTHYIGANEDSGSGADLAKTIAGGNQDDGGIEQEELVDRYRQPLLQAVMSVEDSLTPRQKAVFHGRFLAGIPANELADCLQISRPRISQLTAAIQERVNEAVMPQVESLASDIALPKEVILKCLQDLQSFIASFDPDAGSPEDTATQPRKDLEKVIAEIRNRAQQ